MATTIGLLLDLQAVEHDLAAVRARLRARNNAVKVQRHQVEKLQAEHEELHEKAMSRRREADRIELDLKTDEEAVAKLRTSLNTARTNKEYAAILTQINTKKADNARIEEQALQIIQEVETIQAESDELASKIETEQRKLSEVEQSSADEIARLNHMTETLTARRKEAADRIPPDALAMFERIAASYDGDAMALVEVHGKKPPHSYVCGGCFMTLNPEHVNALQVRDEVRICDNCNRILYLEAHKQKATAPE